MRIVNWNDFFWILIKVYNFFTCFKKNFSAGKYVSFRLKDTLQICQKCIQLPSLSIPELENAIICQFQALKYTSNMSEMFPAPQFEYSGVGTAIRARDPLSELRIVGGTGTMPPEPYEL